MSPFVITFEIYCNDLQDNPVILVKKITSEPTEGTERVTSMHITASIYYKRRGAENLYIILCVSASSAPLRFTNFELLHVGV
jgi:hypothetical protein